VSPGEVGDVFAVLSQPLVPSVLSQGILEFDRIVQGVLAQPQAAERVAAHGDRGALIVRRMIAAEYGGVCLTLVNNGSATGRPRRARRRR
jgi:hypothetical protein